MPKPAQDAPIFSLALPWSTERSPRCPATRAGQQFTELHNSSVTELALGQRSHGGYEVLTEQGGRLAFEPLNRHGAAADQLWTWKAGTSPDSWSFQNVATGQYLTARRHGSVGSSNEPYVWQQIELPAA